MVHKKQLKTPVSQVNLCYCGGILKNGTLPFQSIPLSVNIIFYFWLLNSFGCNWKIFVTWSYQFTFLITKIQNNST